MSLQLPPWALSITDQNDQMPLLWRSWFEQITTEFEALKPGYGASLPSVTGQPDGRYYTLTTTQTLYQMQSGAWVAVDMVP